MSPSKTVQKALSMIQGDPAKVLPLRFGTNDIIHPGQTISKAVAQHAPTLLWPTTAKTYLVVGLDIDAPFPFLDFLSPILHWIQPGFRQGLPDSRSSSTSAMTITAPFVCNYIGPAPPPGGPHRYVFILFEQPQGFDSSRWAPPGGGTVGNWARTKYDFEKFVTEAQLGPVLAANYFWSN